jgi:hypothetical protein
MNVVSSRAVALVAGLFALVTIYGCKGSKAKYVTDHNNHSGMQLTARYVSGTKSVRVKRKGGPAMVDFSMPDSLPRVSGKRIATSIRRFNFRFLFVNQFADWMDLVILKRSHECASIGTQFDAVTPKHTILHVTMDQTEDGLMNFQIRDTLNTPIAQLVIRQLKGAKKGQIICATEWNLKNLAKLASDMNDMRTSLVEDLSKESGFDGSRIGHRLSRIQPPEHPKEGNV